MRSSLARLMIAVAVIGVTPIESAVAQSPAEVTPPVPQQALPNRYEPSHSETDFRLGDHQQLRGYFLSGSQERLRWR
jgi:hypothetical protein